MLFIWCASQKAGKTVRVMTFSATHRQAVSKPLHALGKPLGDERRDKVNKALPLPCGAVCNRDIGTLVNNGICIWQVADIYQSK